MGDFDITSTNTRLMLTRPFRTELMVESGEMSPETQLQASWLCMGFFLGGFP
jgi:hypothetical protein